ncbi:MAG: hypothetical protein WAU45_10835 [Blastocatellia bacterium]
MKKLLPVSVTLLFALLGLHGGAPEADSATAVVDKTVTITISSESGVCTIADPGNVTLKKNTDKIRWCVVYKCGTNGVRVVMDDFQDKALNRRNPFATHSASDNTFEYGPLNAGPSNCNKTSKISTVTGTYKYRITVVAPDGTAIAQIDPGVIITD